MPRACIRSDGGRALCETIEDGRSMIAKQLSPGINGARHCHREGGLAGYSTAYVRPRLEDPGEDYANTGFTSEFDLIASDFDDLAAQLIARCG